MKRAQAVEAALACAPAVAWSALLPVVRNRFGGWRLFAEAMGDELSAAQVAQVLAAIVTAQGERDAQQVRSIVGALEALADLPDSALEEISPALADRVIRRLHARIEKPGGT